MSVCCPAMLLSAEWIVSCTRIMCFGFVPLLTDISCLLFLFRKCFCFFSHFLFFSTMHLSFLSLAYWPFCTCLLACLMRAAILHFSFHLHFPNALSSVVLISDLLYQSAAFVFLDGSRVSEGLVRVSYG